MQTEEWFPAGELQTSEVIHLTEDRCRPGQMISILQSGCTSPEELRFLLLRVCEGQKVSRAFFKKMLQIEFSEDGRRYAFFFQKLLFKIY